MPPSAIPLRNTNLDTFEITCARIDIPRNLDGDSVDIGGAHLATGASPRLQQYTCATATPHGFCVASCHARGRPLAPRSGGSARSSVLYGKIYPALARLSCHDQVPIVAKLASWPHRVCSANARRDVVVKFQEPVIGAVILSRECGTYDLDTFRIFGSPVSIDRQISPTGIWQTVKVLGRMSAGEDAFSTLRGRQIAELRE